jgi:hypothetical protein
MISKKLLCLFLSMATGFYQLQKAGAQNVGIGTANPQKGKLEIAGALGGHTTVLTIGSDGTGISLQRNWPTIGLNQYRDATNTQRFIGTGYAGSIFLSQDDGSIIFTQFGQGNANQEILTATYPFYINTFGNTIVNGSLVLKNNVILDKELIFNNSPQIFSYVLGQQNNLLPLAYGFVKADGTKFRGTDNFTSHYVSNIGYILNFNSSVGDNLIISVTPRSQDACFASYFSLGSGVYAVPIWNKDGQKITREFTFTVFK